MCVENYDSIHGTCSSSSGSPHSSDQSAEEQE